MTMTSTTLLDRAQNGGVNGHDDAVDPAAKPTRRRFSAEFKDRIVDEYDSALDAEERGALLASRGLVHLAHLGVAQPAPPSHRPTARVVGGVAPSRSSSTSSARRTPGSRPSWSARRWRWRSREKRTRSWSCSPRARTSTRSTSSDRHPPRRAHRADVDETGVRPARPAASDALPALPTTQVGTARAASGAAEQADRGRTSTRAGRAALAGVLRPRTGPGLGAPAR